MLFSKPGAADNNMFCLFPFAFVFGSSNFFGLGHYADPSSVLGSLATRGMPTHSQTHGFGKRLGDM